MALGIRKDDTVLVLSGKNRGAVGRVLAVFPKKNRVLVEGVNMVKKHMRARSQQQPGGIIEKEAILISFIGLLAGFAVSMIAGYLIHKTYGLVFEYSWTWALVAAAIGMIGGVLGALYPAWRASNLDAVNALAYE